MRYFTCVALLALLPSISAFAADQDALSQVALFNRCYTHLTQRKPAKSSALMAQVVAGTKTAVAACMEVFDKGLLQASGANEGSLVADSTEGRWVLQSFNDFHRSWFPNDSIAVSVPGGVETMYRSAQLHDESEAALHVTRALLTSGVNYSEVVTTSSGMEALRANGPDPFDQNTSSKFLGKSSGSFIGSYSGGDVNLGAQLVQTGELLGVRKLSLNSTKADQITYTGQSVSNGATSYTASAPIKIHESLGGGILGTRSYLLLNLGRSDWLPADGGLHMPRRWSKAFLKDLLCRDLPAIRISDAQPYVQSSPGANTPPFRSNVSCMQCHASMDQSAAAARQVSYISVPHSYYQGQSHVQTYIWSTTLASESGTVDYDAQYSRRPPKGRLYFRGYDGTLVNVPVTGIAEIGTAAAATDDLYACAASRYFKYFTGVQVNLQDAGDVALTPLNAGETAYRNLVVQLGASLKTGGSLRSLVQSIFNSSLYQRESMRLPASP